MILPLTDLQLKQAFTILPFLILHLHKFGVKQIKKGKQEVAASGYFLIVKDILAGKHMINLKVLDLLKGNEGPPPKFEPLRTGTYEIFVK